MHVFISGSTGLIGSAMVAFLRAGGHGVTRLARNAGVAAEADGIDAVAWDPQADPWDAAPLAGADAVVHLAGENIAAGRWTEAMKARIRDSRVGPTRRLCEALARLSNPPQTLACASAIGYYGDRGEETLVETSPPGKGFLPEACVDWEGATRPAADAGIRVVNLRIGVVLAGNGGALKKMLTPFKLGLGGIVGSGKQYWSWISLDDVVGAIHHAILTETLSGPVNATAPNPTTNYEFTKTLGKVIHRPTVLPLPAFAARLMLGEMADDLLLGSAKVLPERLAQSGYAFRHPTLEEALRSQL